MKGIKNKRGIRYPKDLLITIEIVESNGNSFLFNGTTSLNEFEKKDRRRKFATVFSLFILSIYRTKVIFPWKVFVYPLLHLASM